MNAVDLILDQHDRIDSLVQSLRVAEVPNRAFVLRELESELVAHAIMEETLFYPSFKTSSSADALQAYAEDHQELRALLARLDHEPTDSPRFVQLVDQLAAAITAHAHDEEEAQLLPMVARTLDESQLQALGAAMQALHDELLEHTPYRTLDVDAARPAPL